MRHFSISRNAVFSAILASAAIAQQADIAPAGTGPVTKLPPAPQTPAGIGVLYNNGPFVTAPGLSVVQTLTPVFHTVLGFASTSAFTLADEFTVTDPVGWRIDTAEVFAYQTGSTTTSTFNGIRMQIWNGDPSLPTSSVIWGDLVNNRLASTSWTGNYRVVETAQTGTTRPVMSIVGNVGKILGPGTYWLEYSLSGTSASGPFAPPITIPGQLVTGNALQRVLSTNTWAPITSGLAPNPISAQGMPFVLVGDTAVPPCYETNLGTSLALQDDQTVIRPLGFTFNFSGGSTTSIGICSNGFIWLDGAQLNSDFSNSVAEFRGSVQATPRLAPCWRDFDPTAPGSDDVYLNTFPNRVVITWHRVTRFLGTQPMTVQCQILSDGSFYYYYAGDIDSTGGTAAEGRSLIGVKAIAGLNVPDPLNTDYTAALPLSTTVPTNYEFFGDSVNFDLRNRCIRFAPNVGGGYAISFRNDCGASSSSYGIGCPAGTPLTLVASAPPRLGTTFNLDVTNVAIGADMGALLFGVSTANIPLTAAGFPGCSVYTTMDLVLSLPLTPPTATLAASVPLTPALIGVVLNAQAAAVKNSAVTSTHVSNGLTLVLGKN